MSHHLSQRKVLYPHRASSSWPVICTESLRRVFGQPAELVLSVLFNDNIGRNGCSESNPLPLRLRISSIEREI